MKIRFLFLMLLLTSLAYGQVPEKWWEVDKAYGVKDKGTFIQTADNYSLKWVSFDTILSDYIYIKNDSLFVCDSVGVNCQGFKIGSDTLKIGVEEIAFGAPDSSVTSSANLKWESYGFGLKRLAISNSNGSVAVGRDAQASGNSSTATGAYAQASGFQGTATGRNSRASGIQGTATGRDSQASGNSSTAMGGGTRATGNYSTAIGVDAQASGNYSTAIGVFSRAPHNNSTALGLASQTTKPNQVILGTPSDTVTVPNRLEILRTPEYQSDSVLVKMGDFVAAMHVNDLVNLQPILDSLSVHRDSIDNTDWIEDVKLNGNNLEFTGIGRAFNGQVNLSGIISGYTAWELRTNGTKRKDVTDGGVVDFIDGDSIKVTYNSDKIRINLDADFTSYENVQSDWGQTDNTKDDFIKNKPTIPTDVGDLTDSNSLLGDKNVQSDWQQSNTGADDYIKNKPTLQNLTAGDATNLNSDKINVQVDGTSIGINGSNELECIGSMPSLTHQRIAHGDSNNEISSTAGFDFDGERLRLQGSGQANHILIGDKAGYGRVGRYITAIGQHAGIWNGIVESEIERSTFVGLLSGAEQSGQDVSFFGHTAGYGNTGNNVTGTGYHAAYQNTGGNVTGTGSYAARENEGNNVTGTGYFAAYRNTGENVTAIGSHAARENTKFWNIAIGYDAMRGNTSYENVILIGNKRSGAHEVAPTANNQVVIGSSVQNHFIQGKLGIKEDTPLADFHNAGTSIFEDDVTFNSVSQDNTITKITGIDGNGKQVYRDVSTIGGAAPTLDPQKIVYGNYQQDVGFKFYKDIPYVGANRHVMSLKEDTRSGVPDDSLLVYSLSRAGDRINGVSFNGDSHNEVGFTYENYTLYGNQFNVWALGVDSMQFLGAGNRAVFSGLDVKFRNKIIDSYNSDGSQFATPVLSQDGNGTKWIESGSGGGGGVTDWKYFPSNSSSINLTLNEAGYTNGGFTSCTLNIPYGSSNEKGHSWWVYNRNFGGGVTTTLQVAGGGVINGQSSITLSGNDAVQIVYDGVHWFTVPYK